MRFPALFFAGIGLLLSSCQQGEPAIRVEQAWARETRAGQAEAAVYLHIANRGSAADRLVSGATPRAKRTTLHSVSDEGGIHRMREMKGVDVAGGSSAHFAPGGQHIMLSGVTEPLQAGTSFPLTLQFERSGELQVEVAVGAAGDSMPAEHHR